jgi:putative oxidoreductase
LFDQSELFVRIMPNSPDDFQPINSVEEQDTLQAVRRRQKHLETIMATQPVPVAVVIAGNTGIGRAVANALRARGVHVEVASRKSPGRTFEKKGSAMTLIDNTLRITSSILALAVGVLSLAAFFTRPVSIWATISLSGFLILLSLFMLILWWKPYLVSGHVAALLSALVIGRLFSTMRFEEAGAPALSSLDPLLVAETGPGIASIQYTSLALVILLVAQLLRVAWHRSHGENVGEHMEDFAGRPTANDWGMTALRLYVGLMFVPHFAGHIFAGPAPFGVFADYFGSIGLPYPAAFVVLAGLIELAATIGLAFGCMTRIAAISAAVYLFVSVGLGGHFSSGYIWVLPGAGWEFPALWIFALSIVAATGGGRVSADAWLKSRFSNLPRLAAFALA